MSGLVWAESDLTLDGTTYSDWYFWFDAPILIDLDSGDFVVDPSSSEVFKGQGFRNATLVRASFNQPTSSSGTVSEASGTWDLDYTYTITGESSVTLHMEGDLASAQ